MSQVQDVKDATNIVEIIGERIKLQRAGSSFKALCPFHSEKSPSFNVNEQMQRYKCFGCGENGDVIEFLQKYEGMTFLESLRFLAERAGIELKEFQRSSADDERDRLFAILNLAKEYYHYLLTQHKTGEKARQYLKKRGITQESIKLFQMGYALPSWDGLVDYLHRKKKYSLADIEKTGLVIRNRSGRYYDRYRERIVFPLKNHRGQVVGFSGRLLEEKPKEAKYINSPETSLYHKSQLLFGYSELYREIKKKGEIIVTEGEFDVISSAQAHVNNIVAIKGSALTSQQIKLFERVADKVLLALDADSAGVKATRRAIELMKDSSLELRVINLKDTESGQVKDPDDIARNNPTLWRKMSGQSISVYEFLLQTTLSKYDPDKPEDKRKILTELAPVLGNISLEVERDFYIQKLAKILNVKADLIQDDIQLVLEKSVVGSGKSQVKVAETPQDIPQKKLTPQEKLEEYLLFLLFRSDPEKMFQRLRQLTPEGMSLQVAQKVLHKLENYSGVFQLKGFAATLAEDLKEKLFDWYLHPEYVENLENIDLDEEWEMTLKAWKKVQIRQRITQINKEIEQLDAKNEKTPTEDARLTELLQKIVELQRKNQ